MEKGLEGDSVMATASWRLHRLEGWEWDFVLDKIRLKDAIMYK